MIAASLGIATANNTAGQVAAGNAAAGVELYNRQLHAEEKKTLALEAKRLEAETGKTVVAPGMSWEDLLLFVSGASVDAAEYARLVAAINYFEDKNGAEINKFATDLAVAQAVVKQLAEKILRLLGRTEPK